MTDKNIEIFRKKIVTRAENVHGQIQEASICSLNAVDDAKNAVRAIAVTGTRDEYSDVVEIAVVRTCLATQRSYTEGFLLGYEEALQYVLNLIQPTLQPALTKNKNVI